MWAMIYTTGSMEGWGITLGMGWAENLAFKPWPTYRFYPEVNYPAMTRAHCRVR